MTCNGSWRDFNFLNRSNNLPAAWNGRALHWIQCSCFYLTSCEVQDVNRKNIEKPNEIRNYAYAGFNVEFRV